MKFVYDSKVGAITCDGRLMKLINVMWDDHNIYLETEDDGSVPHAWTVPLPTGEGDADKLTKALSAMATKLTMPWIKNPGSQSIQWEGNSVTIGGVVA